MVWFVLVLIFLIILCVLLFFIVKVTRRSNKMNIVELDAFCREHGLFVVVRHGQHRGFFYESG